MNNDSCLLGASAFIFVRLRGYHFGIYKPAITYGWGSLYISLPIWMVKTHHFQNNIRSRIGSGRSHTNASRFLTGMKSAKSQRIPCISYSLYSGLIDLPFSLHLLIHQLNLKLSQSEKKMLFGKERLLSKNRVQPKTWMIYSTSFKF